MELDRVQELGATVTEQVGRVVVGQESIVEGVLVALLCQGHVLLEGPPGTAKTLLARALAGCLGLSFNRVQFTPDLMPGDVLGTNLFDFQKNAFTLTRGPVFTDFLLADEINRTPPKTQAALLQAMQERHVTIDGSTHPLSPVFMVVATQNPIEHEGTYPLPEAQLDRFLFKLVVPYPDRDDEREVVRRHGHHTAMPALEDFGLTPVVTQYDLLTVRRQVGEHRIADEIIDYVVDLVRATRDHAAVLHGASPRAANMLATAARAQAALRGRDFVIPDDVKELFGRTMRHRLVLSATAEVEGQSVDAVVDEITSAIPAPR